MDTLKEQVERGRHLEAAERVRALLEAGEGAEAILQGALIPAMDVAGERFQQGEYYLPELLIASRAMKACVAVLAPLLADSGVEPAGKVVLGTAKADLHDIGKNLVALVLEGGGFEVIDLGVDVPAARFVEAVREHRPVAVGVSALLTVTMLHMRQIVAALEEAGLRDGVKLIVGGAPVTQAFADEIGADFYGDEPSAAKAYLRGLVGDA